MLLKNILLNVKSNLLSHKSIQAKLIEENLRAYSSLCSKNISSVCTSFYLPFSVLWFPRISHGLIKHFGQTYALLRK